MMVTRVFRHWRGYNCSRWVAATVKRKQGAVWSVASIGAVLVEHIWLGGAAAICGFDIAGKTKTLISVPKIPEELPLWKHDGSSTGQWHLAETVKCSWNLWLIFPDPHGRKPNILVLCAAMMPKTHKVFPTILVLCAAMIPKTRGAFVAFCVCHICTKHCGAVLLLKISDRFNLKIE